MRIVIIRTKGDVVSPNNYNLQEIGLAKAFVDLGHQCDIVYYTNKKHDYVQNIEYSSSIIRIFWLTGLVIAGNALFYSIEKILNQYDYIQVSEYDQLMSLYLAFYSKFKDKVYIYHGPYLNGYNKKFEKKCFVIDRIPLPAKRKNNIQCFAKSELAKSFLLDRGFRHVNIVGVGLDYTRFDETFELRNNCEFFNKNDKKIRILYVGRIESNKNTLFLLNVFQRLLIKYKNIELVIIGKGTNSYFSKFQEIISKKDINNAITWIESVDQEKMGEIYKNVDIAVLPSKTEVFSMFMLESMFFYLPFVTTYHGGSSTVIRDGINGFIVPLEESKWIQCLSKLIDNRKLRIQVGKEANKTIQNKYTWNYIAKDILNILGTKDKK